jgi:hypothetical protein
MASQATSCPSLDDWTNATLPLIRLYMIHSLCVQVPVAWSRLGTGASSSKPLPLITHTLMSHDTTRHRHHHAPPPPPPHDHPRFTLSMLTIHPFTPSNRCRSRGRAWVRRNSSWRRTRSRRSRPWTRPSSDTPTTSSSSSTTATSWLRSTARNSGTEGGMPGSPGSYCRFPMTCLVSHAFLKVTGQESLEHTVEPSLIAPLPPPTEGRPDDGHDKVRARLSAPALVPPALCQRGAGLFDGAGLRHRRAGMGLCG